MKGDFSRLTFDPKKHYSGVNMQQGRVQVDADWNEQRDIALHRDETEMADLVGRSGAPMHNAGFRVYGAGSSSQGSSALEDAQNTAREVAPIAQPGELLISKGRYYVDGILCENENEVAYKGQPDFPGPPAIKEPGVYLAYLDVWSRHVTALEDPHIREVALGGPDTATRLKTVWQVKLLRINAGSNCLSGSNEWDTLIDSTSARLAARAKPSIVSNDPCVIASGAGYSGLENQLYRVEIHKPGRANAATFKWSRDNGSVVTAWLDNPGGTSDKLKIASIGPDQVLGFAGDQWVELTDGGHELRGEPGTLVRLVNAEANVLTIAPASAVGGPVDWSSFPLNPQVRRWDSKGEVVVSTPTTNQGFIALENGVEVMFDANASYKTGDYWLIPARTDTADIEWPRTPANIATSTPAVPSSLPPHGIQHHYCRLAVLSLDDKNIWTVKSDCRNIFPPLTELTSFFYLGGDGQEVMPNLTESSALTTLARPLEVGVANGQWPVAGAMVQFTVKKGSGKLQGGTTTTQVIVQTLPTGIASCTWSLGPNNPNQQVEAVLLNDDGNPAELPPIHFNANLSVAAQVAYDPGQCGSLQDQKTVQSAIERLASLVSLFQVSGDDQSVLPGQTLEPLNVVASSLCGPVNGLRVEFTVVSGGGAVSVPSSSSAREISPGPTNGGSSKVTVTTDGEGLASCNWKLGPSVSTQVVEAVLQDRANTVPPIKVQFTATIQSVVADPGFHVTGLFLNNTETPLVNDLEYTLAQFKQGITIVCDSEVDSVSINNKPVCFVTLEIPFYEPLTTFSQVTTPATADRAITKTDRVAGDIVLDPVITNPTGGMLGFQPVILQGTATVGATALPTIVWTLADGVFERLQRILFSLLGAGLKRLLARLTLKGNFIWKKNAPDVYLDGEVFGAPGLRYGLRLKSGDNRKGGDLEMWFWITPGTLRASHCKIDPQELRLKVTNGNPIPTLPVTISNDGEVGDFTLVSVTTDPPFYVLDSLPLNKQIEPGKSVQVSVLYRAGRLGQGQEPQDVTGSLNFQTNPPGKCQIVGLVGLVKRQARFNAQEIDLGSVTRATAADKQIVILNPDDARLEGQVSTDQPHVKVSPEKVSIDAGGSQTLTVSLVGTAIPAPEKPGEQTATITMTSIERSDPPVSVPVRWILAPEPVKNPILDIAVRVIELGGVTRTTTANNKIVISNKGEGALEAKVSTDPPLTVSPVQPTVDPGGSQKLTVSFDGSKIPRDQENGEKISIINIASNDPSTPTTSVQVKWTLTTVKSPAFTVSPSDIIDLGNVTRTTVAGKTVLKITNNSDALLVVKSSSDQPALTLSPPDQISIDPNGTQKLAVRFDGAAISKKEEVGPKTGTITITSIDLKTPPALVQMKWNLTNDPLVTKLSAAAKAKAAAKPKQDAKPKRKAKPSRRTPKQ